MGKFARYKEQAILFFEENGFVSNYYSLEKKLSADICVDIFIKNKSEVNIWVTRKNMENVNGFRQTNKAYVHFTLPCNKELILKICNSYESLISLFNIKEVIRFRYIKATQENKTKDVFMNEDGTTIINCDKDIEIIDRRLNGLKGI